MDKIVECTALGTPCAVGWDLEWVGRVDEEEKELGRRVCGARSGI